MHYLLIKKDAQMRLGQYIGPAYIAIAGALWGIIGLFIELMHRAGASSDEISFLRVLFSFLILAVMTLFKYGIRSFRMDRNTFLAAALLGIICHGIYNIFYSMAVMMAGITVSAVLLNVAPLFTALISVFFFKEKISRGKYGALALNMFGCIIATTGGPMDLASLSIPGILCGIGAGLCYALTAVFGKLAGNASNIFVISTWSYLFATLSLLPFSHPILYMSGMHSDLLVLGFLFALIPTALAYLFYYEGVKRMKDLSRVPVLASLETVIAALTGACLFAESIGLIRLSGILIILLSIFMMSKKE